MVNLRQLSSHLLPLYNFLYTKKKDTKQFHFTSLMGLILSSKHLPFVSFHTVHHMHNSIILHHFFRLLLPPFLIQELITAVCLGIVHSIFVRMRNRFHSCVVNLQCKTDIVNCLSSFIAQKTSSLLLSPSFVEPHM